MLTVDDYGAIRRARRDGMSIRQISREFGHTRKTVRHVLNHAEPPAPTTRDRKAPLLGPGRADHRPASSPTTRTHRPSSGTPPPRSIAASATSTPTPAAMPRSNATSLKHRRRHRETFIPLGHLPGRRLEADFGHIHVDFPDGRRPVPFLVAAWAYSNAPFVLALPFERTEAILEGMVAAFEFFGGVPREVWWDNPRTVATLILKGRERQAPSALRGAGQPSRLRAQVLHAGPRQREARRREHRQGRPEAVRHARPSRRRPRRVERARSVDWCEAERDRVVRSLAGPFTIKDRLAEDLASASPLPGIGSRPA